MITTGETPLRVGEKTCLGVYVRELSEDDKIIDRDQARMLIHGFWCNRKKIRVTYHQSYFVDIKPVFSVTGRVYGHSYDYIVFYDYDGENVPMYSIISIEEVVEEKQLP